MLNLYPDASFADEDEEEKEASQQVAEVDDPEEDGEEQTALTGCISLCMDQEVNAFNDPKDSKNKKQFKVEDLPKENILTHVSYTMKKNFNWQKLTCGDQGWVFAKF